VHTAPFEPRPSRTNADSNWCTTIPLSTTTVHVPCGPESDHRQPCAPSLPHAHHQVLHRRGVELVLAHTDDVTYVDGLMEEPAEGWCYAKGQISDFKAALTPSFSSLNSSYRLLQSLINLRLYSRYVFRAVQKWSDSRTNKPPAPFLLPVGQCLKCVLARRSCLT